MVPEQLDGFRPENRIVAETAVSMAAIAVEIVKIKPPGDSPVFLGYRGTKTVAAFSLGVEAHEIDFLIHDDFS
jgi:hypothetical protein